MILINPNLADRGTAVGAFLVFVRGCPLITVVTTGHDIDV